MSGVIRKTVTVDRVVKIAFNQRRQPYALFRARCDSEPRMFICFGLDAQTMREQATGDLLEVTAKDWPAAGTIKVKSLKALNGKDARLAIERRYGSEKAYNKHLRDSKRDKVRSETLDLLLNEDVARGFEGRQRLFSGGLDDQNSLLDHGMEGADADKDSSNEFSNFSAGEIRCDDAESGEG